MIKYLKRPFTARSQGLAKLAVGAQWIWTYLRKNTDSWNNGPKDWLTQSIGLNNLVLSENSNSSGNVRLTNMFTYRKTLIYCGKIIHKSLLCECMLMLNMQNTMLCWHFICHGFPSPCKIWELPVSGDGYMTHPPSRQRWAIPIACKWEIRSFQTVARKTFDWQTKSYC